MPEISRFYGLIILMNYKDHNPPHFHLWYGDYKALITIEDGIVKGEMPQRALQLVFSWLELHKKDLLYNWELAQKGEILQKIEPLK
ncbi:MAG: DUF4160 domain-containing protein [Paludibacter sp.]|jgi:hypothetical protein|nr:DUF4160 domain-containing protein [Paludibacter sp.]